MPKPLHEHAGGAHLAAHLQRARTRGDKFLHRLCRVRLRRLLCRPWRGLAAGHGGNQAGDRLFPGNDKRVWTQGFGVTGRRSGAAMGATTAVDVHHRERRAQTKQMEFQRRLASGHRELSQGIEALLMCRMHSQPRHDHTSLPLAK